MRTLYSELHADIARKFGFKYQRQLPLREGGRHIGRALDNIYI